MTIRSHPTGAEVVVAGKVIGRTPLVVSLPRRTAYRLEIRKEGFQPAPAVLLPSSSGYDQRLLRRGVDYASGAANSLLPGDLVLQLRPAVLPQSRPVDALAQMAHNVAQADELLAMGRITAQDHRYAVAQIIECYSR